MIFLPLLLIVQNKDLFNEVWLDSFFFNHSSKRLTECCWCSRVRSILSKINKLLVTTRCQCCLSFQQQRASRQLGPNLNVNHFLSPKAFVNQVDTNQNPHISLIIGFKEHDLYCSLFERRALMSTRQCVKSLLVSLGGGFLVELIDQVIKAGLLCL